MYEIISNYIYLYHTQQYIVLPSFPDSITNSNMASFNATSPMLRSAPIYSYSHSGPRTISSIDII